jgi:hypothetical protein
MGRYKVHWYIGLYTGSELVVHRFYQFRNGLENFACEIINRSTKMSMTEAKLKFKKTHKISQNGNLDRKKS